MWWMQVVEAYSSGVQKATGGGWSRSSHTGEAWKHLKEEKGAEVVRNTTSLVLRHGLHLPCFLLNGMLTQGSGLDQYVMHLLAKEQNFLSRKVANQELAVNTRAVLANILSGPQVFKRYNPILDREFQAKTVALPLTDQQQRSFLSNIYYFHAPSTADTVKPLSFISVMDFTDAAALHSLASAFDYIASSTTSTRDRARLAVVSTVVSSKPELEAANTLAQLLHAVASKGPQHYGDLRVLAKVVRYVTNNIRPGWKLGPDEIKEAVTSQPVLEGEEAVNETTVEALIEAVKGLSSSSQGGVADEVAALAHEAQVALHIDDDQQVLLLNGRVMPLKQVASSPEDFEILASLQLKSLPDLEAVVEGEEGIKGDARAKSDLILSAHSFIKSYNSKSRVNVNVELQRLPGRQLLLEYQPSHASLARVGAGGGEGKEDIILKNLVVTVVLDPLSDTAQRAAPLLTLIRDHLRLPLRVLLVPNPEITEFPLKSYYRFALQHSQKDSVVFDSLPQRHLLTVRPDVAEPWNVQTKWAVQDLDNLRCDAQRCGDYDTTHTYAEYTLKNLLVYGQCFDSGMKEPVNGLQLILREPSTGKVVSDTLVMQNYGYFQLQADAGVYRLSLAEGRAKELFDVVKDWDEGGVSGLVPGQELVVAKKDFYHGVEKLFVRKKKGKQNVPLLDDLSKLEGDGGERAVEQAGGDDSTTKGMWNTFSNLWSGSTGGSGKGGPEKVHVFSLATGQLYERMLKIMMLSVTKRTSVPVKFWLLENFLSPAFKEAAKALAKEFGFEVEFITYKWPDWLRQQTEKQRIIWGYKILFLDVLFPLHLKKVIYVDADQVVRADLKELWDMDLKVSQVLGAGGDCDGDGILI